MAANDSTLHEDRTIDPLQDSLNQAESILDLISLPVDTEDECKPPKISPREIAEALPGMYFNQPEPTWKGGKQTNTEAREITAKLRAWTNKNMPDHSVNDAAKAIEDLFSTVWTEIDEALCALSSFKRILEKRAPDTLVPRPEDGGYIKSDGTHMTGLEIATMYLHRWQDRGGAMGNVRQSGRLGHPMMELAQAKENLHRVYFEFTEMGEQANSALDQTTELLWAAYDLLPEDNMRRQRAIIEASIKCMRALDNYIQQRVEKVENYNPEEVVSVPLAA